MFLLITEVLIALAVVAGALVLALRVLPAHRRQAGGGSDAVGGGAAGTVLAPGPTVFLFDGERLIDATPAARALVARLPGAGLQGLMIWLEQRLPGAGDTLCRAEAEGMAELAGQGARGLRLRAEALGGALRRVTLMDAQTAAGGAIMVDALSQAALEDEAAILRDAMDGAPVLAWRQDAGGAVTWANHAYLAAAEAHSLAHDEPLWPLPRVMVLDSLPAGASPRVERREMPGPEGAQWFDCHIRAVGAETIIFALPADAAVRAERSLREFVQTLTKTFADLPIGLAIFDRDRNLQLFNPSLIDLTTLSAGFLIGRPSLFAFLDQLRERRMIPEPKDYRGWRRQIASLEAAAAEGHHVETWSLPGGQTYRVTGRPHPDGAIAFLFEDITSEITLTRRFRADISLGVNALDALGDAVAVFGADGRPALENAAWRACWGEGAGLAELAARINARLGEVPGAARLRDQLTGASGASAREVASGTIATPSGGLVQWRVAPMPGGLTLLSLSGEGLGLVLRDPGAAGGVAARDPVGPLGAAPPPMQQITA